MSVKASVSISEQQDEFVRELVAQGRYSSVSAVIQHGLELLRKESEMNAVEIAALRALLQERLEGDFVADAEARSSTVQMIARKKANHGL